jgi:hypothetical protein
VGGKALLNRLVRELTGMLRRRPRFTFYDLLAGPCRPEDVERLDDAGRAMLDEFMAIGDVPDTIEQRLQDDFDQQPDPNGD